MNILIIISQYLPAQTPNTLRWEPLARRFSELDHEVSILTTRRRGRSTEETMDGIRVYRAGYNSLQDRSYDVTNAKNRRNETQGSGGSGTGLFSSMLQRMVDKTWRRRYWPDGSKLFLKPGIELGKKIVEERNIDKVISVGLPFTCHLIARTLKESSPEVQWHMDIQDPFSYSKEFWVNNFERYEEKNIEEERKAFALADTISVTNPIAKERYDKLFPTHSAKQIIIPPLFHLSKPDHYEMFLGSHLIHLTYCGSFYTGVRSIEPFLEFLKQLKEQYLDDVWRIQFHLVGQLDRETRARLDAASEVRRMIVVHGFKNRAQSFSAMEQSGLLMNFGNTTDYHLPSKVVDFLYLCKPIVNFITTDADSTKAFLEDKSVEVLNMNLAKERPTESTKIFMDFVMKQRGESEVNPEAVQPYSVTTLAEAYLNA